jgi:hypothetical protein
MKVLTIINHLFLMTLIFFVREGYLTEQTGTETKPLHVTVDYPDDIESAGHWYKRKYIDLLSQTDPSDPKNRLFFFAGDGHPPRGQKMLNEEGCCLVIGRNDYLTGALHPCYPQVQQYWISRVQSCMDAGVDGIDIRICNHSSWTWEGEEYGFNEPAVKEYKRRYGIDVLIEDYDKNLWKQLNAEYWLEFINKVRIRTREQKVGLQLHVSSHLSKPIHGGRLNNLPMNFAWNWQQWISKDLCDAVHLKWWWVDRDFASRVASFAKKHGKTVTESVRLEYRKMTGAQNDRILDLMKWGMMNDHVDALVLYEGNCFTRMDKEKDEIVIVPAMIDLLENAGY